jgi:hypothetical protein
MLGWPVLLPIQQAGLREWYPASTSADGDSERWRRRAAGDAEGAPGGRVTEPGQLLAQGPTERDMAPLDHLAHRRQRAVDRDVRYPILE